MKIFISIWNDKYCTEIPRFAFKFAFSPWLHVKEEEAELDEIKGNQMKVNLITPLP